MFRQMSMMMTAAAVLVFGSPAGLVAQERPDFSGTWVVERVEFRGPQGTADGARRSGKGRRSSSRASGRWPARRAT